jgi:hypothetical protein|tara:strand:- start:265 stop:471 length:207 start_codon:yes stop_codon:yes gene_type:complete
MKDNRTDEQLKEQLDLQSNFLEKFCLSENLEVTCSDDLLYGSYDLDDYQKDVLKIYGDLWQTIAKGRS